MYIIIQKYKVEINTRNIIIEKIPNFDTNTDLSLYRLCDFFSIVYNYIYTGFINFRYNNDLLYFGIATINNRSAAEQNVLNLAFNCLFPNGCRYINVLSFYELLYRSMS